MGIRVFFSASLHNNVQKHHNEGGVTQTQNKLFLKGAALYGIGNNTAEEEDKAAHYRGENLIKNKEFCSFLIIFRVEFIKPWRKAGAENGVNRVSKE